MRHRRQFPFPPPPPNSPSNRWTNNGFSWDRPDKPVQFRNMNNDNFYVFDAFSEQEPPNALPFPPARNLPNIQQPTSTELPASATDRTPCEKACLVTPQYNPVCGDNNQTFSNEARLRCAQRCGKRK